MGSGEKTLSIIFMGSRKKKGAAMNANKIEKIRNYPVSISKSIFRNGKIDLHLRTSEAKLLNVLLAFVKQNDQPGQEYTISIADIYSILGYNTNSGIYYREIKRDFQSLCQARPDAVQWLKRADIEQNNGTIKYCFSDAAAQYIYNLGADNPYIEYRLIDVIAFRRKASFVLFLLMKAKVIAYKDQYGNRRHTDPHGQRIEFDINQLKSILGAKGYFNSADFMKRCIIPALQEINGCSHEYNVKHETNKRGVKITSIVLIVSVKLSIVARREAEAETKARLDPEIRKTLFQRIREKIKKKISQAQPAVMVPCGCPA